MFTVLHQKYIRKKSPPPSSQTAIDKQMAALMPLSVIHALKKFPSVEFGGLLIGY